MKGEHFRNRVTVYYLLLEHFGLLHMFGKTEGKAGDHGVATVGLAGAAAAGLGAAAAGLAGKASAAEPPVAASSGGVKAAAYTPPPARPVSYVEAEPTKERNWLALLSMLLVALLAPFLLWLLLRSLSPAEPVVAAQSAAPAPAPTAPAALDLSTAPAEGTVAIPTGAGVTAELRDGKPVVKVYFDTGKADVVPDFAATAAGLKAYLAAHSGTSLAVSGFNDKTGNAAANAILSKNRAKAVDAVLTTAGIASSAIALVKPSDTTDTSVSNANARRVDVVVH
jgi:outer membrane protein OmpA-like peptidoglycan-associated protein